MVCLGPTIVSRIVYIAAVFDCSIVGIQRLLNCTNVCINFVANTKSPHGTYIPKSSLCRRESCPTERFHKNTVAFMNVALGHTHRLRVHPLPVSEKVEGLVLLPAFQRRHISRFSHSFFASEQSIDDWQSFGACLHRLLHLS